MVNELASQLGAQTKGLRTRMDDNRKRPPSNSRPDRDGDRRSRPNERGKRAAEEQAQRVRGSDPNNLTTPTNPANGGESARKRSLSDYKPGATDATADEPAAAADQPTEQARGGLLSRFAAPPSTPLGQTPDQGRGQSSAGGQPGQPQPPSKPLAKGATPRQPSSPVNSGADAERAPRAGEWSASDFDSHELEAWDHHDDAPFELPESPDDTYERTINEARKAHQRNRSGAAYQRYEQRQSDPRDSGDSRDRRDSGAYKAYDPYDSRAGQGASRRQSRRSGWDDFEDDIKWDDGWNEGWQTGQWDTGWATGLRPATTARDEWEDEPDDDGAYNAASYGGRAEPSARRPGGRARRRPQEEDDLSQSLNTLAQLSAVGAPLSRLARVRMLFRRRPTAAAMLAFFLLGFMLTCCAPMIPMVRLAYDATDAYQRVTKLQTILAGGTSQLLNTQTLSDMQTQLDGLSHDLYEINGAVNVVGAPLAALSSSARNDRLLVRIGFDLTTAGDEALQMAQIVLRPLQGGALAATGSPGIQPSDIQQARSLLANADSLASDALIAYHGLNTASLPSQLKPGSKYGKLLAELPLAPSIFAELKTLLDAAPALLGIGQPAYFLVVAMDSSELRPGGGFQGNYGILEIDGGKQSSKSFSLNDTYSLDSTYAINHAQSAAADPNCQYTMPEPPNYYWWWPIRCIPPGSGGTYGWGLRDSNLSPDFPTNARTAMQIAEDGNGVPNNAPLQGEVAFTPALIAQLMALTGNITLPDYNNVTVTPQNLQFEIHDHQLGAQQTAGQGRKQFTHELGSALLAKLKTLHGAALKSVFTIAIKAIESKDLQVYLADPRAELILQQLGMASTIATGNGDGFFVVDTNVGGNKANSFVTEHQTDLVTLTPNGGAYHNLEISVTYNKTNLVFTPFSRDYNDLQRTYLPGDATIIGWSGFNPADLTPSGCSPGIGYASFTSDCTSEHGLFGVSTDSDVPGRTMVLGALTVLCGPFATISNITGQTDQNTENTACDNISTETPHTMNIFISWYTPHAYTANASGHGTWSELVERQAGSNSQLTVYIANGHNIANQIITDPNTFASELQNAKKIYDQPLATNITVTYAF